MFNPIMLVTALDLPVFVSYVAPYGQVNNNSDGIMSGVLEKALYGAALVVGLALIGLATSSIRSLITRKWPGLLGGEAVGRIKKLRLIMIGILVALFLCVFSLILWIVLTSYAPAPKP